MPRLYRPDLGGVDGPSPVDLVLVSHAHVDHCGLVGLLRRDVPIATSPQSLATLTSIEATSVGGWETDYTEMRLRGALERKDGGDIAGIHYKPDELGPTRRFSTASGASSSTTSTTPSRAPTPSSSPTATARSSIRATSAATVSTRRRRRRS